MEEQFIKLVQTHEGILYKVIALYTDTGAAREDLYQEIVLQLWRAFPRFRGEAKVTTWMYRIALNVAATQHRQANRRIKLAPLSERIQQLSTTTDEGLQERLTGLRQQINQLEERDRALVLLYLDEYSYAEIAQITGLSPTNVGTRLSRIKQQLRKRLVSTENIQP
jgi:RNA polymerase sigma-70 factor (ECF subfamily)